MHKSQQDSYRVAPCFYLKRTWTKKHSGPLATDIIESNRKHGKKEDVVTVQQSSRTNNSVIALYSS